MIELDAEQLCAAYRFLRTLPPLSNWHLPHESYIEFQVVRDPKLHGWHKQKDNATHVIAISESSCGHAQSILFYTAHEMVHLAQEVNGTANRSMHNKDFKLRAKIVCDTIGLDYKVFV